MFILHVEIPLKEGTAERMQKAYAEVYESVKQEQGCKAYKLTFTGDGKSAAFFEIWESDADLAAHMEQSYIKTMLKKTAVYAAGKPTATRYDIESVTENAF